MSTKYLRLLPWQYNVFKFAQFFTINSSKQHLVTSSMVILVLTQESTFRFLFELRSRLVILVSAQYKYFRLLFLLTFKLVIFGFKLQFNSSRAVKYSTPFMSVTPIS